MVYVSAETLEDGDQSRRRAVLRDALLCLCIKERLAGTRDGLNGHVSVGGTGTLAGSSGLQDIQIDRGKTALQLCRGRIF